MSEEEKMKLWESYQKTSSPEIREKLIVEYAPLVKLVAGRLCMYLGNNVEYEDLVGYGVFGLIDAIDKFDLKKTVKFETYASLRIRGSILDQIRKMDWIPRTLRQKQRKMDTVAKEIEQETGRIASDAQIAERIGISEEELLIWQSQMKATNVISLNEYLDQGSEPVMDAGKNSYFEQPDRVIEQQELKEVLEETLETLTEKEKKVVLFYYYEDLTLKEIAGILEVSESRVSQLHTKALQKMKQRMGSYMDILIKQD